MEPFKQYSKLPLPETSAWDRKTYDPVLRLYRTRSEWPDWADKAFNVWFAPKQALRGLKGFLKRLRVWIPVIWKDRDWDDFYIFEVLKTKLLTQREYLIGNYRHTGIPQTNRDITTCLNLIERFVSSYYETEHFDYYDTDISFVPVEEESEEEAKFYTMNSDIQRDNLLEYIEKYPLDRNRTIIQMKGRTERPLEEYRTNQDSRVALALFMASYRHQKCKKLLFRILEEKIEGWWD